MTELSRPPSNDVVPTLLKIAESDKVLKTLIDTILIACGIPIASLITTGITGSISYLLQKRTEDLFTQLANNPLKLSENDIKDDEFIHKFLITYKAVTESHHHEKRVALANLLLKGTLLKLDVDSYEDYLSILKDISFREFYILNTLSKHQCQFAKNDTESELEWVNHYWNTFIQEINDHLGLTKTDLDGILVRLNRTGCYRTITGSYYDYLGDKGFLTPLYFSFSQYITDTF